MTAIAAFGLAFQAIAFTPTGLGPRIIAPRTTRPVACASDEALAATLVTELSAVADEVLTLSGGGAPPPAAEPIDDDALGHDALDGLAQSAANRLDQHLTEPPPTTNKLSGSLRRLKVIVRDVRDGVGHSVSIGPAHVHII